ncbi:MAG: SDR family oxidoreductase [Patescibacteria group bacterium]
MTKNQILITGGNGLVGSKLIKDFSHEYDFINLDRNDPKNPVDITDYIQLRNAFEEFSAPFVINMAAFTNVSEAWKQAGDKDGSAYRVNVYGASNVVEAAEATGKHLIHISTAYVFDGEKEDLYTEKDNPNPIEWYGKTKYLAEQAILNSGIKHTILRIDTPFRSDSFEKPDQVRKTIQSIKNNIPLFTDHYFGPTYIDDFARIIDWVIRTNTTGLYHASSGEKFSDYEFGTLINETLNLDLEIKQGSLEKYLKTASRPLQKNTAMDCNKLKSEIHFELTNVKKAIGAINLSQSLNSFCI